MNTKILTLGLFALTALLALYEAEAAGPLGKPACEAGYTIIEETVYKEVCRNVCKMVPDVKKTTKWVYSTIDSPFCLQKTPCHHGHCGDSCPTCQGPYCRKQLVKIPVVEECPTTKCVVEQIKEMVPCKVYRKVPCGTAAQTTAVHPSFDKDGISFSK